MQQDGSELFVSDADGNGLRVREAAASKSKLENSAGGDTHTTFALSFYFREISRFPLLTRDEERAAGMIIRSGPDTPAAMRAREMLAAANLRLVVSIARQFDNRSVSLEDLISEGNEGLLVAINRFDPSRFDNRFSTYATHWVARYVRRALSKGKIVRIPRQRESELAKILRASSFSGSKEDADPEQLAIETGIAAKNVRISLRLLHEVISIDQELGGDRKQNCKLEIRDAAADPAAALMASDDLLFQAEAVQNQLGPKERLILMKRFGIHGPAQTLQQLALAFGWSRDRVSDTIQRALQKLRKHFEGRPAVTRRNDRSKHHRTFPVVPETGRSSFPMRINGRNSPGLRSP